MGVGGLDVRVLVALSLKERPRRSADPWPVGASTGKVRMLVPDEKLLMELDGHLGGKSPREIAQDLPDTASMSG